MSKYELNYSYLKKCLKHKHSRPHFDNPRTRIILLFLTIDLNIFKNRFPGTMYIVPRSYSLCLEFELSTLEMMLRSIPRSYSLCLEFE